MKRRRAGERQHAPDFGKPWEEEIRPRKRPERTRAERIEQKEKQGEEREPCFPVEAPFGEESLVRPDNGGGLLRFQRQVFAGDETCCD